MRHACRIIILSALVLCGCVTHKDLTCTPEVQQSGILGQRLKTTQSLVIFYDKNSRTLRLGPAAARFDSPRVKRVGVVAEGTELRINKVIQVRELVAILIVLPVKWQWRGTMARIESGVYLGKEVAVDGESLKSRGQATIESEYFVKLPSDSSAR